MIHLKVTTDNSLLKSLIKIKDLISFLVANNINACGICDDDLSGTLEYYLECKKNNIKPIIGLSIKINELDIYLYAINYNGYKDLIEINSNKDNITMDYLSKYINNLLVIIPFKSISLYRVLSSFKYLYLGYSNTYELTNSKILTNNVVYVNDIRTLKKDDTKYLNYLDKLDNRELIDYSNSYYNDVDIDLGELLKIVNLINIEIPLTNSYMPEYTNNSFEYLTNLSKKGLYKRLNGNITNVYMNRLNYELSVINKMGFNNYFLIVYDYILYAKKNNILVGPGRGSAAGSLVSYSLGITEVDPIKYNLLFERFLNPERITMPDIDVDFDALKRDLVIDYLREKYGKDNIALGLTFSTYKSKLVLKDVGKILKVNPDLLEKFIKNINPKLDLRTNLNNDIIKKYLNNYKELKEVYNVSLHLEGLKKNTSIHASAVIISKVPIKEIIPIHIDNNVLITGVPIDTLESIGLLKMDFLALKNLSMIAKILNMNKSINLKNINYEDVDVYKLFQSGNLSGVIQFETNLLTNLSMRLKPTSFNDLVALLALGRPGAINYADSYINRKNGKERIDYIDSSLEPILKGTYGIILYQEQIMQILVKIANYSYGEADVVRRAISKKKESILNVERNKFISRAISNGYPKEVATKIMDNIMLFASYGFNKAHSVAYAKLSYQMAYLKVYYPIEFTVSIMNNGVDSDTLKSSLNYLKSKNIRIIKPDINISHKDYYYVNNALILPLYLINNITNNVSDNIIDNKGSKYIDLFDFVVKNKFLNEDILIVLIKSGSMDSLGLNKNTLINNVSNALNYSMLDDGSGLISKPSIIEYPEVGSDILRKYELDSFNIFISNHPSSRYNDKRILKLKNIESNCFKTCFVVVLIERIKRIKTKKGEDMVFLTASDETGSSDFTIFPKDLYLMDNININDLVEIKGEVSRYLDRISIKVKTLRKVSSNE